MDLTTDPGITVDLEAIHAETQLDQFWINVAAHTLGRLMWSVPASRWIGGTAPSLWECALELAAERWRDDIRPGLDMPSVETQPVAYVIWALGESLYEDTTTDWFRAGWDDQPAPAEAGE